MTFGTNEGGYGEEKMKMMHFVGCNRFRIKFRYIVAYIQLHIYFHTYMMVVVLMIVNDDDDDHKRLIVH